MASAGGGLVPAAPPGPAQLLGGCGRLLVQAGEEPADLVAGQRDQPTVVRVAAMRLCCGQDRQERAGEQGEDGPAVQDRGRYKARSMNAAPAGAA
jgi:hypothetical protein